MIGQVIAYIGLAICAAACGVGSAIGLFKTGSAAAGVLTEDAKKFSKVMVLVLLPATQGLYGFVMALVGQGVAADVATLEQGWLVFAAAMPLAVTGLISAIYQGKTSVSCIYAVAKDEKLSGKLIMFPAMVETYAIFGLVVSLLFTLSI
ncbi:MAG TPA: V-type ATP synthase subunit K [Candidatus Gallimonas intestinigallinarum]|uniref:V-type ATP synthase subunit K n=1 Tax=Candidatus Gallimonas intestinigallinarum TaxID=2838604 RepID=A0A9D2IVH1_9FIRM|nr:V-type ATP synthase subunit K [Candidatus Gallimonas intestinigallinarum]